MRLVGVLVISISAFFLLSCGGEIEHIGQHDFSSKGHSDWSLGGGRRVLAELELRLNGQDHKVVRGAGLVSAGTLSAVPGASVKDIYSTGSADSGAIKAQTVEPPDGYKLDVQRQFDFLSSPHMFLLDETTPLAYAPYGSSVASEVPGLNAGGYRYDDLSFRSLSVFVDSPSTPSFLDGTASVTLEVTPPPEILEVVIPKFNGETVTVTPPVVLRQEYEVVRDPTTGEVSARTRILVNGILLGEGEASIDIQFIRDRLSAVLRLPNAQPARHSK